MKDCIKCGICCLGIGMLVGGIVVAKNRKLAANINGLCNQAEQKFNEVKDDVQNAVEKAQDKIEEMKEEQKANSASALNKKKN